LNGNGFSGTLTASTTSGEAMAAELQLDTKSSKSDLIATVSETPMISNLARKAA
jgi:hypothetical protein